MSAEEKSPEEKVKECIELTKKAKEIYDTLFEVDKQKVDMLLDELAD